MEIPFTLIDWLSISKTENPGEQGKVIQQTLQFQDMKVRIVEYSAGYFADHWCQKGHVVYCLEGSFESHLESGEKFHITKGMAYVVSDQMSSHRSSTLEGTKLFIVDGGFLK